MASQPTSPNGTGAVGRDRVGGPGSVSALAASGTDLYVGGYFRSAGGIEVNNIAKWDGSSWSALGSGLGRPFHQFVSALVASGTDLYAGGYFVSTGGVAANHVAKWNGSSWSTLGSGVTGRDLFSPLPEVSALAVSGSDLYAGGHFTTAGDSAATNIAKWNGSSWSPIGSVTGDSGVSFIGVSVYGGVR